jgi:hypothetical protein
MIRFRVSESEGTFSGYCVGVVIDNGFSVRQATFSKWETALQWLQVESRRRQDPAGRDMWNFDVHVSCHVRGL